MKIEKENKPSFQPIVIRLETYNEASKLMAVMGSISGQGNGIRQITSGIYDGLTSLGVSTEYSQVLSSLRLRE